MWKNIFLESCLLSALIFGGLYINAHYIKGELYEDEKKVSVHISGVPANPNHISGEKTKKENNISGSAFSSSTTGR
ncbi:MAG: hypothetical protein VW455_14150 [Nitrospinota bacterium]